jgi:hypothetical protein
MKSVRFLPPVIIVMAIAYLPAAMADNSKNITVTNNTTYTMTELYASSTYHGTDWSSSANLLSGQSIGPGQSATIAISDGTDYCHYDFMGVLYGAAQAAYQYTINTCDSGSAHWSVSSQ